MSAIDLIALAEAATDTAAMAEARRAMEVCNACRYCEGYCAVFPAMELRRKFLTGDLNYLANLCHGCQGCFYACQYAPPHEFGINVPKALAEVRNESYAAYAWPKPLAKAFERAGLVTAISMAVGVVGVLLLVLLLQDHAVLFGAQPLTPGQGFYRVVPEGAMVATASATLLFSLLALSVGCSRFWRDTQGERAPTTAGQVWQGLKDAATLKYLGGGGHGCNDVDDRFSTGRRRLHHAMAYGFVLCFAATSVGAFYDDVLGWRAPYPLLSLPVILGTLGGIGIVVGTTGLLWQKLERDQEPQARNLLGADAGLLLLLLLIAATGLMLLGVRGSSAMGVALTIHLGLVVALFATMPYSKFVHGLYRTAALVRFASEKPHD